MSTSKKISQLNTKTSLNDNDKFLIVDSVSSDNKSVTALTIKNYVGVVGGGNILIFDYSQFVANAGVVYPIGTVIYYKDTSGKVTGVHKVADGINTLANLPLIIAEYNIFDNIGVKDCPDFAITIGKNTNSRFVLSTRLPIVGMQIVAAVVSRYDIIFIDRPILVYSISKYVSSYTSPGILSIGIYKVDETTKGGTLIPGSDGSINITSVGKKTLNYATALFLDVGAYYLYFSSSTNTFGWLFLNTNLHRGILDNTDNYVREGGDLNYIYPPDTIGPLTVNNYAKLIFELEYLPAI